MTGDRRVLVDDTNRTLARIVDGLHDIVAALDDRRFAIVGGIAVLTHVQGHRVTQDIDSAARGRAREIHDALLVVAEPDDGDADVLLTDDVDRAVAALQQLRDAPPRAPMGRRSARPTPAGRSRGPCAPDRGREPVASIGR